MVQQLRIPKRIVDISVGVGNGSARSFRQFWCSFDIKSWARSKPNEAKVRIYNCSEDTLRYLEGPNMVLTVNAGFDVPGQLFQGAISTDGVDTTNKGPDWITSIAAADGRRSYRDTLFVASYPAGTTLQVIINDIAIAMGKPVVIDPTLNLQTFTIPNGWTFSEKARSALKELLWPYVLEWTIIGGVLYIVDPKKPLPGNAPLITPESGLHGSPQRTKKGCKLKTDLNPAIIAGKGLVLKSRLLSGTYRNEEVQHTGDSWGTKWMTSVQGTKV
jgi:hypothetical protein